ncbi:extracellular solute-binding protein [Ponticoccus sp. SC2-23]|uniref:extracellular solute-binding protein n=1 Tax=Alexandriicola marinus TaxID=2081710 RepID=UPI000FD78B3E|nr:extracellular solute-binding protein [Alexandriicola marinus]MBM1220944.1 extracellular solute-binding protein [Ponticoccus sp. SC6-9]MBM1225514.1 extracellular solute-binding protein [Ponticoccus sp. SC6-15]MBM1227697.1 extracellular solute-binding protein [Ponticoccus sp. SC6-38]MBM1234665.1 extracellular solute-binding protein [Ponticoccus sp. SC6-45]MBM1238199.1 extracellular solute-binding protein [Ponticoccus sp. SC6-49]MBM1244168.1 extracellular solute-binding protein [Ponticoccus s
MNKFVALAAGAMMATAAQAQETVVWWDFLGGGDGVRMKQLISEFNEAHEGEIAIDATTLEWGVPFYTKVQTSVAVGEAPDVMTYHASRIPLAVQQGVLDEITPADWEAMGFGEEDFAPAIWNAVTGPDGKTYGVPLDTHPIVLYYNKDILGAAGQLDENGLPIGLGSGEDFTAMLQALADSGEVTFPLGSVTADGNFMFRTIYSLMGQQGGELMTDGEFLAGDNAEKLTNALTVLQDWTNAGLQSTYTDYPATVALFTSGEAAMMINGVWEVPTMTDLHADGKLFEWGAVELPMIFDQPATYSDSHVFAIPAGSSQDPEKRAAVLEVMSSILQESLFWATAGHIPAYNAVTNSDEFKMMEPNATYSSLTANMIYDPQSPLAGVAGPMFDVMSTYFVPVLNGEMDPAEAVEEIAYELNDL